MNKLAEQINNGFRLKDYNYCDEHGYTPKMNLENKKPDFVVYASAYLFDRAQHLMNRMDYSAALVMYMPDGTVKVRWRKR